ncbi:MAG: acyltransferase family protein [Oligoflexales bacterium]|nr:acyltransferase family protein [Oligoflexales bacterium]
MNSIPQPKGRESRIHGLDAMRACMMLLGLIVHAAGSYVPTFPTAEWPFRDPNSAPLLLYVVLFIKVFRMPAFFMFAGFFTALLLARQSVGAFLRNRGERILVPLIVGWAVLYLPTYIGFTYANTGEWFLRERLLNIGWQTPGILMHLWFLYYLLFMYTGALLARRVALLLPTAARKLNEFMISVLQSRWRLPLLSLPMALVMFPVGYLPSPMTLLPNLRVFTAYSYCFFVGWHLYKLKQDLGLLVRAWPTYLFVGVLAACLNIFALILLLGGNRDLVTMLSSSLLSVIACWGIILGLIGIFLYVFPKRSPIMDYLMDASYWIYLIHVPIVTNTAALLKPLTLSGYNKFILVVIVATAVSLLTYQLFVRYSFIGAVLNGRRNFIQKISPIPVAVNFISSNNRNQV